MITDRARYADPRALRTTPAPVHPEGVLRELRGPDGGPHPGTRFLALGLALLLAAPLTVLVWRVLAALTHALVG